LQIIFLILAKEALSGVVVSVKWALLKR